MKRVKFFAYVIILMIHSMALTAQVSSTPQQNNQTKVDDQFQHTVERGQTVYAIATMYGVGVDEIYRLNPESKVSIQLGAKLIIPQKQKAIITPANPMANPEYIFHTIKPRETLYAVRIKYDIPAEAILAANPGLSTETFTIGKTIRIPHSSINEDVIIENTKTIHKNTPYKIKKKDTFYSICRRFDVTKKQIIELNPKIKGKLKAGATILIPEKFEIVVAEPVKKQESENEINALLTQKDVINKASVLNVSLLLPFTNTKTTSARTALYIEYYEGFLLAVDSLKNLGYSINLSVYDTGSGVQQIKKIINEHKLQKEDVVIGGVENAQINLLAQHCASNKVKYVIPLTSKNDDVLSNAYVFQVNTPQAYLFSKASQAACSLFKDYNIVILKFKNDREEKTQFIETLKMELKQQNIAYKELVHSNLFVENISALSSIDKPTLIIPSTASSVALSKIMSPLRTLKQSNPEFGLTLFGYPEWQTYTNDYLEDFYALNTYIYSYFYANNLSSEVKNFYQYYKKWYSKNLIATYPKYGMLGFDTGFYFLKTMHTQGINFEKNINKADSENIQTGFFFERVNNWGGFINTNLFIVHFKPDYTVTKTAVNQ